MRNCCCPYTFGTHPRYPLFYSTIQNLHPNQISKLNTKIDLFQIHISYLNNPLYNTFNTNHNILHPHLQNSKFKPKNVFNFSIQNKL